MTGREMIIYILANGLENEPIINNGKIMGYIRDDDAAVQLGFGPSTVQALITVGTIPGGVNIGNTFYIPITKWVNYKKNCKEL